jgi:type VI secretion system protein ImpJ
MVAKSSALSKWRHRLPSGQIRFLTTDFAVLGVLQAINGFIPLLNYYRVGGKNHPERLYEILTSLAGQLTTFSTADAADLPHYDHAALGDCFGQLEAKIQEILGEITGANYISILLEKTREALYVGRLVDDFVLEEAGFYLLASGEAVDRDTVEKLSAAIKIASPETIDAVFESMTEGLGIHTTEEPPAGLPAEPGKYYFRLDKQGPFWEAILRSRSIAIWTPADFANFKIELIAVR